MALSDQYFKNRQSTRAYKKNPDNPLEAGGPAVGGLTESTRYNRQQVGASYLSAPTGTGSWTAAPGSRGMGRGGYVDMPTDGPTPLGGAPDRPQRMGPAGPSAMAQGVAGRFERPSENTFQVTGRAGNVIGGLAASGFVIGNEARKARKAKREALKGYEDYDVSATLSRKRQNFPAGKFPIGRIDDSGIEDPTRPVRPALDKYNQKKKYNYEPSYNTNTNDLDPVLNEDPGLMGPGHWDFAGDGSVKTTTPRLSRYRGKYNPNLSGSGQSLQDINLEYGLPTAGLPELGMGSGDEYPAKSVNMRESLGRSQYPPQREPTGDPIPLQGPPLTRFRNRFNPGLGGSGQSVQDVNLEYGLPTSGLPELGEGAGDEYPARNSNVRESLGRSRFGPQREPTGSPIEMGAVPAPGMTADVLAGQPRALPAGTQRRVGQRVDEPQAPGPGPSDNPPPRAVRQSGRTNTRSADPERERQARNRANIPLNWR